MFWWRLSYSTQNGSAFGSGKFVPCPTCCSVQANGFFPSYPVTPWSSASAACKEMKRSTTVRSPVPAARRMSPA